MSENYSDGVEAVLKEAEWFIDLCKTDSIIYKSPEQQERARVLTSGIAEIKEALAKAGAFDKAPKIMGYGDRLNVKKAESLSLVLCADQRWGEIAHLGLFLLLLQDILEKKGFDTTTNGRDWILSVADLSTVKDAAWNLRLRNAPHFDFPLRYIDFVWPKGAKR